MKAWHTIFSGNASWWRYLLALAVGILIPIATSAGSDMIWVHEHRAESAEVFASQRQNSIKVAVLDARLSVQAQEIDRLVKTMERLTDAINQERAERAEADARRGR